VPRVEKRNEIPTKKKKINQRNSQKTSKNSKQKESPKSTRLTKSVVINKITKSPAAQHSKVSK